MRILLLSLVLILTSCLQDSSTPEGALKDFVESRLNNVITRQFVLDRVTGQMKQSFANMSDEDFEKFSDLRKIKRDSFKILSKSCQEKKCFVTYSVGYKSEYDDSKFMSEVKKIAEMLLEDGKWLISDVSNIKTYHEALDPINP